MNGTTPHRLRILNILPTLSYGGMERLISDMARRIDRSRFQFGVLCLQYLGRFSEGLEEYADVILAPRQWRGSLLWPRELATTIRQYDPHVVHCHSGVWYKAARAARMAGVTAVIHTEHGRQTPDPLVYRIFDGVAARKTDRVIAVSEVLAEQLRRSIVKQKAPIQVILNGVDTAVFRPRPGSPELRTELSIPADAFVIGSIGRLEHIKGYDVMVRAYSLVKRILPDRPMVLLLAGEGSERENLEALARSAGSSQGVRFLGWRDDITSLHAIFDLYTLSSRSEGTSVSLLEAMSAEICPVVTDVGGNRAVLGPSLAHRLVQSDNPAALAEGWAAAITAEDRRKQDAETARKSVVRRFDVRRMVHAYEHLYHEVLEECGRQPQPAAGLRSDRPSESA
ncbi:MAG: glycosyltransferase [Anaerolineales bacterium]|nr:glycosyltransferase [Anaerolineales bacterium]